MTEYVIFMIEGGRALELVKEHIAEKKRVATEVRALAKELGVEQVWTSSLTGALHSVQFPKGKCHSDFTKPDRKGASRPKRKTEWAKRFDEQKGCEPPSEAIAEAFSIPLTISFRSHDGEEECTGCRMIGRPFYACGFLWLSEDGPYAMWVPDVPAEVAADEAQGYVVAEPAKSFKLEFDGCRRIEREEWDILVAQHNLAQKRIAKAHAA